MKLYEEGPDLGDEKNRLHINAREAELLWCSLRYRGMPKILVHRMKGDDKYNLSVRDSLLKKKMIEEKRASKNDFDTEYAYYRINDKGKKALALNYPELFIDAMGSGNISYRSHKNPERRRMGATVGLMCLNAGIKIMGFEKPSIYEEFTGDNIFDCDKAYFYDSAELKEYIIYRQHSCESKHSACCGVVVKNHCLYFMYFLKDRALCYSENTECGFISKVIECFERKDYEIDKVSQVIVIGRASALKKLCDFKYKNRIFYIHSGIVSKCYCITNDETGENQLKEIVFTLKPQFNEKPETLIKKFPQAVCDFESKSGEPVFDLFHMEIKKLLISYNKVRFYENKIPVIMCHDFYEEVLYEIFGARVRIDAYPFIAYED